MGPLGWCARIAAIGGWPFAAREPAVHSNVSKADGAVTVGCTATQWEGSAMRTTLTCMFIIVGWVTVNAQNRPPIIDMHLHAHRLADYGGGMAVCANDQEILYAGVDPRQPTAPASSAQIKTCASPVPAAANDEAVTRETLSLLDRYNIFAVTTGPLARVREWRAAVPDRIIPAHAFGDPARRASMSSGDFCAIANLPCWLRCPRIPGAVAGRSYL